MYNRIKKIEEVLKYIEENIETTIACEILAQKMNLSVYEFRRIFAFIIGCPISEYIRKRKLSLAACEIMASSKVDMRAISEKYGYATQAAFTKAFKSHHGVAPTEIIKEPQDIQLFTMPKLEFSISSRETIPFKIISEPAFSIQGYTGTSPITDTCCCESVWNAFYESGTDKTLETDIIYATYHNHDDDVTCCIGKKVENGQGIPASKWACFTVNTTDDDIINETYGKILYDWLPSTNAKKNNQLPIVEVYPLDMSQDGFSWEIRIPLKF